MNCPTCGLTNPPEALRCDCGYDFQAQKAPDWPGTENHLNWGQKIAAYWSISWPSSLAALISARFLPAYGAEAPSQRDLAVVSYVSTLVFFAGQALFTHRLVRKNYRSFRIGVIRANGQRKRKLSLSQGGRVWIWLLVPQVAFQAAIGIPLWIWGAKIPPEIRDGIPFWVRLLQFLVVGPWAIDLALRVRYPGFRLQGFSFSRA